MPQWKAKRIWLAKQETAQVVGISQEDKERIKEEEMDYFHRSQAWITGFLPADNPNMLLLFWLNMEGVALAPEVPF